MTRDDPLFEGAPPLHLACLGVGPAGAPRLGRAATLAAVAGWLPPALLAAVQGAMLDTPGLGNFMNDVAVHARALLAVPLLILADAVCSPRLTAIARQFQLAGLVPDEARPRFDAAITSTRNRLYSPAANTVLVVLAYALCFGFLSSAPAGGYPAWQVDGDGALLARLSPAGWWHALVSLPLLLLLALGWLWRLWLWARLLWLLSRMDLRLVPSHPDLCAGLRFLGDSVRAFAIVALALAIIGAGRLANDVVHYGLSPFAHKYVVVAGLVGIIALFLAPLLVFTPRLLSEWRRGVFEYGALAGRLGRDFERKWLGDGNGARARGLEAPDFSAVEDLYQITANVHAMRLVPVDAGSLAALVTAILLPFVPVVLLSLPLGTVFGAVARLFL